MHSDKYNFIHVALPVMAESEYLPATLDSIQKQSYKNFKVYICVNQPESFRTNNRKAHIFQDNQKILHYLKNFKEFSIELIDRSSEGFGWETEKIGVGWARKTLMDTINEQANKNDLIISLDADTTFNKNYFQSIITNFNANTNAVGMSVPYYHQLTEDESANRAMLRYEIYMRNYAINLLRIISPYAFTALGSAMALPIWTYRNIRGITPKTSGEDFYFLQKLKKYGKLLITNDEKVFPGTRFSNRVFFGTGPAMIKGNAGDWTSYPIYHYSLFNIVKKTYDLFPALFEKDIQTPMNDFLIEQFGKKNIWQPLRKNCKDVPHFVKACHDKLDGLRILQFFKSSQEKIHKTDEECLQENLKTIFQFEKLDLSTLSFKNSPIDELDFIRNFLVKKEEKIQKENIFTHHLY